MHIEYKNNDVEKVCNNLNEAKRGYLLKLLLFQVDESYKLY